MTCDSCVSPPSRIGQDPPSISPYQDCFDQVGIGNVSTEHLLEQLKATLQLSQSVATAWSDGATLDCAIAYNILLHQRDRVGRGWDFVTAVWPFSNTLGIHQGYDRDQNAGTLDGHQSLSVPG